MYDDKFAMAVQEREKSELPATLAMAWAPRYLKPGRHLRCCPKTLRDLNTKMYCNLFRQPLTGPGVPLCSACDPLYEDLRCHFAF